MAKKTADESVASPPVVGDIVIYEYGETTMPAIVEYVDADGRLSLTGFQNGKTVHLPNCKDGSWHRP